MQVSVYRQLLSQQPAV